MARVFSGSFCVPVLPAAAWRSAIPAAIMQELQKLAWQRGPGEGAIGAKAKIRIPQGYAFLDDKNTRRFLELMGNPPRDGHYMIAPANLDWFAVFSFDPVGYVKDDEKIDADALLDSLKKGDAPGNEERKRLGMAPIYTDGWHVPPHYDTGTKRLEWGMRLRDEKGGLHVNYTSRLLGRSGVMSAVLVSSPQTLARGHEGLQRARSPATISSPARSTPSSSPATGSPSTASPRWCWAAPRPRRPRRAGSSCSASSWIIIVGGAGGGLGRC